MTSQVRAKDAVRLSHQVCPYPGPARRGWGCGELSAAFCRLRSGIAGRLPRAGWHDRRARCQLIGLWHYAEMHLATREGWEINL